MIEFNEFTLVFDGDIREYPNPYTTETQFGTPIASSTSNAFDQIEELEAKLEEATYLFHCIPDAEPDQGWAKGLLSYSECRRFNNFKSDLAKS